MPDSQSLRLVYASADVRDQLTDHLAQHVALLGYDDISAATLDFLGALDCGENIASDIARSLGVSRQMVAKTVRELSDAGYLEQTDGPGKTKPILFTERGEFLMSAVRSALADLDRVLCTCVDLNALCDNLETVSQAIRQAFTDPE